MLTDGLQMIVQRLSEMKWSDYLDILLVAYLLFRKKNTQKTTEE